MAISFKGAHFPPEVMLMGVRWYLAYPLSARHVEELMEGRVEGRRAGGRWRVSSPTLSIVGWVHNSTMATFPAPATSNAACGFPALRFPARFMPRVMRPRVLGVLSAVAVVPGSC
jgi:hypothetical protein